MKVKRLIANVVKRKFHFTLFFEDGHTQDVDIEAESISAAELMLPKYLGVVKYECSLDTTTSGEDK